MRREDDQALDAKQAGFRIQSPPNNGHDTANRAKYYSY
jgi:hypothetical protein